MRVQINNVSHDFGGTIVLRGVHASITTGRRIGVVGPNGGGKSTLIRIVVGELPPTSGTVSVDGDTRIGYVAQSMSAPAGLSVGDYLLHEILTTRGRLRDLEEAMGSGRDDLEAILAEYAATRELYDSHAGDTAEERAKRLLAELGLEATLEQELASLSGGEQNVLALARAALAQPDLLVLDEPGNHLDFAGLAWLDEYLRGYRGAVLVVSHNRYLLDRVAETIWELERGRLVEYTGNYSDYRFARLQKALSDQATHKVQQAKLARLEKLVQTFEERARVTADPAWGKRLRARRTQLEKARETSIDRPELGSERIDVSFDGESARSDIAIDIRGYSVGFGDRRLLDNAHATIHVGERVGIIGTNGSGKTTLLEELISRGRWEDPVLRIGPSMRIGYCAQKRDRLPSELSVHDAMLRGGNYSRNEIFGVLSRLRFEWDDLERPVGSLSGGEWNRLQLGMAIIGKANLLILDEPTNHLDIPSREAVEEALGAFRGTVVAVSHDRYFLDAVAQRIVELKDRRLESFAGSFSEFWFAEMRASHRQHTKTTARDLGSRGRSVKNRKTSAGREERSETIEREITRLEGEKETLEAAMNRAFDDGDYRAGRKAGADLEKVRDRIEELYEQWE